MAACASWLPNSPVYFGAFSSERIVISYSRTKSNSSMDDYRKWFQEYSLLEPNKLMKDSEILKAMDLDELDPALVEERIQQATPAMPLVNGFCHNCQKTFDNWPTVGRSSQMTHESSPSDFPDETGWETAVARHCTTFEIESGTRAGCRFCTFLLQGLKDTELLEMYRKVETRLHHLGEDATTSLSIQDWAQNPVQLLWLNLPGKVCTHCNSGMAIVSKFTSSFLSESGTSPCCCGCLQQNLELRPR